MGESAMDQETDDSAVPQLSVGPKLELDALLRQLIDRAQDVVSTQGRLRGLLRANRAIVGNLSLPVLLREIVQAACELAQARYGALGVIDSARGLEQFVHSGIEPDEVARIGHLPAGKGLLGALIDDPRPIRLPRMSDDPRSVGFPAHHPAMTSFLGVPIRSRDEIFGNLYLTESRNGEFSAEDEELVAALAATAGVAIENARLYEEARRRQDWLQASTDVTRQLLSEQGEDPLALIARLALTVAGADLVAIVLPTIDGDRLVVEVAAGEGSDQLTAHSTPIDGTVVGLAFRAGEPVLIDDLQTHPADKVELLGLNAFGPVMVLPLCGSQQVRGALVIGRMRGRRSFARADLEMATTFSNHAAIALELADARADQQRLVLLEDRDRIARDLHDHVIQRLFAIGLTVQSVASGGRIDDRIDRLNRVVSDIDETIRQTRTSIFQLRGSLGPQTDTTRIRLLAVASEVGEMLGFEPHVRFAGPVDAVVPAPVVDDLVAVVREALTNSARHAQATSADVEISASLHSLTVMIADDGVGIGEVERRSGLANLRERAEQYGGSLELTSADADAAVENRKGTRLLWKIPL
jgi:signal transduction histidine kinase